MENSNNKYRMGGATYKSPFSILDDGYFDYQAVKQEPVMIYDEHTYTMNGGKDSTQKAKKKKRPKSAGFSRKKETQRTTLQTNVDQSTAHLIHNMNTAFTVSEHIDHNFKKDTLKFDFLKKVPPPEYDPQNISTQLLKENKHKTDQAKTQHNSQIHQENMLMYKQLLLSLQEANHYATLLSKEYYFAILTAPSDEHLASGAVKYDRDTLIQKTYGTMSKNNTSQKSSSHKNKTNTIMNVTGFYKLHATLQRRYFESTDREKQLRELADKANSANKSRPTSPTNKVPHTTTHEHNMPLTGLINQQLAMHNKHWNNDGTINKAALAAPSSNAGAKSSTTEAQSASPAKKSSRRVSVLNIHSQIQQQQEQKVTSPIHQPAAAPPLVINTNINSSTSNSTTTPSTPSSKPSLLHTAHPSQLTAYQAIEFRRQIAARQTELLDFIERRNELIDAQTSEIKMRGWNLI